MAVTEKRSDSISPSSVPTVDSAREAFLCNDFSKCMSLLGTSLKEATSDSGRRRLRANMMLCEAKSKAELYYVNYQTNMVELFPRLRTDNQKELKTHHEAVAAFNLALNAYIRGNRRTALEFLQRALAKPKLNESLFFSLSLLEIEMSLTLCQPKLALKQAVRLRENPLWRKADYKQKDYLDILECRIRCRLAQTSSNIDFFSKPRSLHWILMQSELDMKNGNASRALNRLMKVRPSSQDEERRLIDNAIGCVYALSLKKPSLAESYFRSSMAINPERRQNWQESTISRHCLIYHAALAQLHSGKAETAFSLFLAVLSFHPKQPRIWLRLAECCIHTLTKSGCNGVSSAGSSAQTANRILNHNDHIHVALCTSPVFSKDQSDNATSGGRVPTNAISWEYAAHCIRNALVLTGRERDCVYLLPWLYAASSFINLNLERYGMAYSAACQLAKLPQVSPHHKLMATLFKTEALVSLDRLPEALECLSEAVPLQSIPSTILTVIYNRALLQALSGNLHKALSAFQLLISQPNVSATIPEAIPLGIYINGRLGKVAEVQRLVSEFAGERPHQKEHQT